MQFYPAVKFSEPLPTQLLKKTVDFASNLLNIGFFKKDNALKCLRQKRWSPMDDSLSSWLMGVQIKSVTIRAICLNAMEVQIISTQTVVVKGLQPYPVGVVTWIFDRHLLQQTGFRGFWKILGLAPLYVKCSTFLITELKMSGFSLNIRVSKEKE